MRAGLVVEAVQRHSIDDLSPERGDGRSRRNRLERMDPEAVGARRPAVGQGVQPRLRDV